MNEFLDYSVDQALMTASY